MKKGIRILTSVIDDLGRADLDIVGVDFLKVAEAAIAHAPEGIRPQLRKAFGPIVEGTRSLSQWPDIARIVEAHDEGRTCYVSCRVYAVEVVE